MPDTSVDALAVPDGSWTRREIFQQAETLRATQALLIADAPRIARFLAPLLADSTTRVVLTGAGTSAFIGESLAPFLAAMLGRPVDAVATTDIVSAPRLFLDSDRPTLLVSFGRSGNSPESLAAIRLAQARLARVHHLVITCNADGALARLAEPGSDPSALATAHVCAVVLPDATHDRGFAMTSSFSAMTYAALAIFTGPVAMTQRAEAIARSVADALAQVEPRMAALAQGQFDRVAYLGSGTLKGLAREAALKLLELTDGAMVTSADTPLGFRHGPKTIVTARTLVMVFLSNDPLTRRYDLDLLDELRRDGVCGAVIAVSAQDVAGDTIRLAHLDGAADADLLFACIVPAQLLGLHAALHLGLTPDRPNASGTVNRVVQGVRIHDAA